MTLTRDALLHYFSNKLRLNTNQIGPDTSLFTSGLIDSFSMVELVLFIEESCGIRMKPSEINLDNLDSIERILSFVKPRSNGNDAVR
jgi:acyl carrier protein